MRKTDQYYKKFILKNGEVFNGRLFRRSDEEAMVVLDNGKELAVRLEDIKTEQVANVPEYVYANMGIAVAYGWHRGNPEKWKRVFEEDRVITYGEVLEKLNGKMLGTGYTVRLELVRKEEVFGFGILFTKELEPNEKMYRDYLKCMVLGKELLDTAEVQGDIRKQMVESGILQCTSDLDHEGDIFKFRDNGKIIHVLQVQGKVPFTEKGINYFWEGHRKMLQYAGRDV